MRKLNAVLIVCLGLIFAPAIQAQNTGANDAELNGDYAFTVNGMVTGGGGSAAFAAVGRFTADGAGNITNGEVDINGADPRARVAAQPFTATYRIGADHRGVMTFTSPLSGTIAFAMMANGNAQFVEVDTTGGLGEISSGTIEKVDTTAYDTAKITGDYAFGFAGFDAYNDRTAVVGRFTANGAGTILNGAADVNQSGTSTSWTAYAASYMVSDSATGRGTMILPPMLGGNVVFYVVNSGKFFAMRGDTVTLFTPLLNGVVRQQQSPAGGFSPASLNGGTVIYLTGLAVCSIGAATLPKAVAGLLTADGNGGVNVAYDENCGGTSVSVPNLPGTYSMESNGRATINLSNVPLTAYLVSSNQAFFLFPGGPVLFGFGEPQTAQLFTNSAVMGTYAGLTTVPATPGVHIFSGEFTADGVSPTGSISGIEDVSAPSGLTSGVAVNATYSISSSPTNGRGTIAGGIGGSGIVYVISPSKFVVFSSTDPNPAVLLFVH